MYFLKQELDVVIKSVKFLLHRHGDQLVKRGSVLLYRQKTLSRWIVMASRGALILAVAACLHLLLRFCFSHSCFFLHFLFKGFLKFF